MSTGAPVLTTTTTKTYIDGHIYWNYIFPIAGFIVGTFGLYAFFNQGPVQRTNATTFRQRMASVGSLGLNLGR